MTESRTLYEDWKTRRDVLASAATLDESYRTVELRLLDFLLDCYRGSPQVEKPARFPLRTELYLDRRAIIVHRHLGKGYLTEIQTIRDAEEHVRTVLERMANDDPTADRPLFYPRFPSATNESVEAMRSQLCDSDAAVRVTAVGDLGQFGDLDDIGLISDLLTLPRQPDEHPRERQALLSAMQKISIRYAPGGPIATRQSDFWRCGTCGSENVAYFEQCWKCGAIRS